MLARQKFTKLKPFEPPVSRVLSRVGGLPWGCRGDAADMLRMRVDAHSPIVRSMGISMGIGSILVERPSVLKGDAMTIAIGFETLL
jgi:hypothetical protein